MKQLIVIILLWSFMYNAETYSQSVKIKVAERNDLIINEVMYAPTDSYNEWIEIYNRSANAINISNWKIADGARLSSPLTITTDPHWLNPGEYFLLCDDTVRFNAYFGFVPARKLEIQGWTRILGNTADTVVLYDQFLKVIDSMYYHKNWGGSSNTISLERRHQDSSSIKQSNWSSSVSPNGSTPGCINSISLKQNDLSIVSGDISFTPPFPDAGQPFTVSAKIKNLGSNAASNFQVRFMRIIENDTVQYFQQNVASLASSDSIAIQAADTAYEQGQWCRVLIQWSADEYIINNAAQRQMFFSGSYNKIVVNEIMYAPTTSLGYKEWVEIYNRSEDTLNIKNWKFADVSCITNPLTITTQDHLLSPGDYFILCEDTNAFNLQFGNLPVRKIRIGSWPGLNNDLDMVVIMNHLGIIIDSVFYSASWGGDKDGKSLERRSTDQHSNSSANWGTSQAASGATPGALNSIAGAEFDVGISAIGFSPAFPEKNQIFQSDVIVKNYGVSAADTIVFKYFRRLENDSLLLLQTTLFDLADSVVITIPDTAWLSGQTYRAEVAFSKDQKSFNNAASKTLIFGAPRNSLAINEIMYSPLTGNAEWIEIVNRSADTMDLRKWMIADESAFTSNSFKTIVTTGQRISPGEFVIICEDSVKFKTQYPWVTARKFRPSAWITLAESDMIVITDSLKKIVDSVFYEKSWGGGSNKSLERVDMNASTTLPSNWGTSIALAGATPGTVNSLNQTPYDAGIAAIRFIPAFPEKNEIYAVELVIKNFGILPADTLQLNVTRIQGNDSTILRQSVYYNISDSVIVIVNDTALISGQVVLAEIIFPKDQKSFNNAASKTLIFGAPRNSLAINEIMYSPSTGNAEWIEIVNRSADTMDMRKWMIADESAFTSNSFKTIVTTGQRISPGEFVIICEDSVKFKTQYPWVTARKFRPSAWITLAESDMIVITDSLKKIVDSVFYEKSWGGGSNKSLERVDMNASTTLPSNWGTSIALAGATPGTVNSITPFDYDLAAYPQDFTCLPTFPQPGDTLRIQSLIRNAGLRSVSDPFTIKLFDDGNFDGIGSAAELIDSVRIDSLPVGESFSYEYRFPVNAGNLFRRMVAKYFASIDSIRFILFADYSGDQRQENNIAVKTIRIGTKPQSIVINEILYYPDTNQVEFAELYNRSDDTINLKNWTIADASPSTKKTISTIDFLFYPGQYLVMTSDSTIYRKFPDVSAEKIIYVKSLAAFNNDKDAVVVKDAIGAIVDSVYYYNSWGGKKGVSLERISVNRNSNDPGNWGGSIALGGASPGTVNGILTAKPAFRNALIINEIMYAPFSGEPEYIEIYNPTDSSLNLANWSLQVNETKVILTTTSFDVPAGEYVVISENRNMPTRYKSVPRQIKLSSMPNLSNTGATVMIRDLVGTVIDSVTYDPDWGGQNGLSLERIKPLDNGNIRTNWGSCMFVEGGTPGYLNSIYTGDDQPNKIKLHAEPNPFFVDRNEQTKITIELPVTQARLTLKIFDNQGRLIRTLLNNSYSGSYREVLWDGKDNSGHFARMGIYVMFLEAVNENPKFNKSAKKTVVLGRKL